jgi:hypothetical protein
MTVQHKLFIVVFIPDAEGADVYTRYRHGIYSWTHIIDFASGKIIPISALCREPVEEILVEGEGIHCEQYNTWDELMTHNMWAFL